MVCGVWCVVYVWCVVCGVLRALCGVSCGVWRVGFDAMSGVQEHAMRSAFTLFGAAVRVRWQACL